MNAAVYLNGVLLGDGGKFSDPVTRNWNRPLLFSIPPVWPILAKIPANALYDGLVAELKKAGIDVVSKSDLEANTEFKEIRDVSRKSPHLVNDSTIKKMSLNGYSEMILRLPKCAIYRPSLAGK